MTKAAFALLVAATAVPLWGCDSKNSPTSPTSTTAPPTQSGPTVSAGPMSISGRIDSVTAPDTITINGQRILVSGSTAIRSGSSALTFGDLQAGAQARVAADFDGSTIRANSIDLDGDVGRPVLMSGVISGMSRTGTDFGFRVNNEPLRGNGDTQVVDGSAPANSSNLRDGQTVTVEALQRADHVYAKKVTVDLQPTAGAPSPNPSPSPGPSPSPSPSPTPAPGGSPVTITGLLSTLSGVCPALVFPINGQLVVTSVATAFIGGTCEELRVGATADVVGTVIGGQVVATQITIR